VRNKRALTAKTLSNEVLPAFCKPIIVISISVALRQKEENEVSKHTHDVDIYSIYNQMEETEA